MNKENTRDTDESHALEATTLPASSREDKDKVQAKVVIFNNWCKGCGLCVAFCPKDVLEMSSDGRVHVVAPERCIVCHWCDTHCPDFAILVRPLDEDSNGGQAS